MKAVPDSSPLILLSKLERLDLLSQLYTGILIVPSVWKEAVTLGKSAGAVDALYLERYSGIALFKRVRFTPPEKRNAGKIGRDAGLGRGEAETLAVAKSRRAIAIVDDKTARIVAAGSGIAFVGTLGIIFQAFLSKILNYGELIELLEKLAGIAWISSHLITEIIRQAGKEK